MPQKTVEKSKVAERGYDEAIKVAERFGLDEEVKAIDGLRKVV